MPDTNANSAIKVLLLPQYRGPDNADGGIRRVVEAAQRWLPSMGIELVDTMAQADVVASHALETPNVPIDIPWVAHCHGLYYEDFGWEAAWYQKANKILVDVFRQADYVTAPSEWVAQTLRRGMWLKPNVLPHGVNPEEWEPSPSGGEGYVLWNKARSDAASDPKPVAQLSSMLPAVRFVTTFGESAPNVKVTGALPYEMARDVVKQAGVYLATTRETFGIGTIEAMAAGVPIVGWAWGGQREIIKHKETGWLATPGDYEGLRDGIMWAIANKQQVGEAARREVLDRYTWESAMQRYADLYRRAAQRAEQQRHSPKVSVIVPCYNLGKYLGETLASVQAQTMQDFECIIVDDASTDNSAEVAAEYVALDARFHYLKNDKNEHVSFTRNRGMAVAQGRYFIPIDADDRMTPNTLELLSKALDQDRGLGIAYGGLQVMSEAGELRNAVHDWPGQFSFSEQIQGRNQIPTLCMFRRSMIERTGGYRKRLSPVEDADLWTRAASIGFVPRKVTQAVTLQYRLRSGSISRSMPNPEWAHWYPWSRQKSLVPFGAAIDPPANRGAWPVPSYEPVKVSVIIPVGPGHETILLDALDSVEAQVYRQWECIVVNDTGAPLPFVPSWVRVLETEGRVGKRGPAHARNLGIKASVAPAVIFLDADDFLQPDALDVLLNVYKETGGVVYSQWYDDFGGSDTGKVYDPPEYDARLLTRKGCIHAVTALYPKAALIKVGLFDEQLSHWEDWDIQLSLAAHGVCGTKVARPLWTYRKATGDRREANIAAFEQGKAAILAKWGRVWDGKEELMACRSCPGGGGKPITPAPQYRASGAGASEDALAASQEGLILIELLDVSPAVTGYRGKGTGAVYRFGNTPTAKVRYVHPLDAPMFLAMPNKFRRVQVPASEIVQVSPQLTAPMTSARSSSTTTAVMAEPFREGSASVRGAVAERERERVAVGVPPQEDKTSFAGDVASVLSDKEAVAIVGKVAAQLEYREIKEALTTGAWSQEQAEALLREESASPRPRRPIIKLLEAAIFGAPVASPPVGE